MIRTLAIILVMASCKMRTESDTKDVPLELQGKVQFCLDVLRNQALDASIFKNVEGFDEAAFKKLDLTYTVSSDAHGVRGLEMSSSLGPSESFSVSWKLELESEEVIINDSVKSSILLLSLEVDNSSPGKIVSSEKVFRVHYASSNRDCELQNVENSKVEYIAQPGEMSYLVQSVESDLINGTDRPFNFTASTTAVLSFVYGPEYSISHMNEEVAPFLLDTQGQMGFLKLESDRELLMLDETKKKLFTFRFKSDADGEVRSYEIPEFGRYYELVTQDKFKQQKFAYEGFSEAESMSKGVRELKSEDLFKSDFYLELSAVQSDWTYQDTEFYFTKFLQGDRYLLTPRKHEPQFLPPSKEEIEANRQYLKSTDFIEINHAVVAKFESSINSREFSFEEKLIAVLHETSVLLDYNYTSLENHSIAPLKLSEAVAKGKGVCQHYAVVFAALARRIGIPTRIVGGLSFYSNDEGGLEAGGHGWVEVLVEGGSWIPLEPQAFEEADEDFTNLRLAIASHTYFPIIVMREFETINGKKEDLSKDYADFTKVRRNYLIKSLGQLPNLLKTGYVYHGSGQSDGSNYSNEIKVSPFGDLN